MSRTALVALSGGVDSAVTAWLLRERGYRVIGATLRLRHPDDDFYAHQRCGTGDDAEAVAETVAKLKIEHHWLDRYPDFAAQVLTPAWQSYKNGLTPNPCVMCNPAIKFGGLIDFARQMGAELLATGHYATIVEVNGHLRVKRGNDRGKDQSYFLYRLTQEQLEFTEFPLGNMLKSEVKELAVSAGLERVSARRESQDACFACEGEPFSETLRRVCGDTALPGVFIWRGKVVGKHAGAHLYTIGQRKGLNVALGVPAYVKAIDPVRGEVELTTDPTELERTTFNVTDTLFHADPGEFASPRKVSVQIRYRSGAQSAETTPNTTGVSVKLEESARAVTPGQSAVFYDGDIVAGGGVIE